MKHRSLRIFGLLSLVITSIFGVLGVNAQTQIARETSAHPIPQIPIKIDGVPHAATAIKQFNGKPLYSVFDANAAREGVLYVFTSEQQFDAYLRSHGAAAAVKPAKLLASPLRHTNANDTYTYFYEDIRYDPPYIAAEAGQSALDLSYVCCLGISGSWNDAISSVKATPVGRGTYLYEHRNYGGSYLYIAAGQDISDLRSVGWNDRASSFKVLDYGY